MQQFIVHCSAESLYQSSRFPAERRGKDRKDNMMLTSFIHYVRTWREYGTTVRELASLNDRELADLGITRSDIPHVAWQHARAR